MYIKKMAKLSRQLQQGRVTRTQRLQQQAQQIQEEQRQQIQEKQLQEKVEAEQKKLSDIQSLEEYRTFYNQLDPDVKPYFAQPSDIEAQQQQRIQENINKVDIKIESARQELEKYDERKFNEERNRILQGGSTPESKQQQLRDLSRSYAEERDYWRNYIRGLEEAKGKLSQGEDISYSDILSYSKKLGKTEQQQTRAEYKQTERSEEAYQRIVKTSPYAPVYQKIKEQYGLSNVDFSDPKTIKAINKSVYETTYQTEEYNPEQAYKEWQTERASKPVYLDVSESKTALPYQTRGTVTDQQTTNIYSFTSKPESFISTSLKPIFKIYSKIPSGEFYFSPTKNAFIGTGAISLSATTPFDINLTQIVKTARSRASAKSSELITKQVEEYGIQEKIEPVYQEKYQTVFEDKYMKKLIYGDTTFEKASAEFQESKEAKQISQEYSEAIEKERTKLPIKKGVVIYGLNLGKNLLGTIETPKSAITTGALVYTGSAVLKAIPSVSYGITGGTFTYGIYKTFSPLSTPEERVGGIVTAIVSGAFLTKEAIRYLRKPTYKQVSVEPKLSSKQELNVIRKISEQRITDVYGKTTVIKKYDVGGVYKGLEAGRKTITSRVWRDWIRSTGRFFGADLSEEFLSVYRGIPTQQLGKTYIIEGLRGTNVYTTPSVYQKELAYFQNYGYSLSQTKDILRYTAPKYLEIETKAVSTFTYGDAYKTPLIRTEGTRIIKQPSITIDDIRTRGATTIKENILGRGKAIGEIDDKILYRTTFDIEKYYLTSEGASYQKLLQAGKTTKQFEQFSIVEVKGTDVLEKTTNLKGISLTEKIPYENIFEKSLIKQTIPRGKISYRTQETLGFEGNKNVLGIDYRDFFKVTKQPEKISTPKGTPIEQYTKSDLKKLIKTLRDVYGKEELTKITKGISTSKNIKSPTEISASFQELKTSQIPSSTLKTQVRDLLGIKEISITSTASAQAGALASVSILSLKQSQVPKQELKLKVQQRLTDRQILKQAQIPAQAQVLGLRQAQTPKLSRALRLAVPTSPKIVTDYVFKPPKIPPVPPIILLPLAKQIKKRSKKSKQYQELAYLPDFTSRALGLDIEKVSEKEAQQRIKRILTGLEIRRGISIK